MDETDRKRLYKSYITNHFGSIHLGDENEFSQYHKYFRKNYLAHLPIHRNARILDLGCGMGHFLNFLEKEGYHNYLGIDLSQENIEFCKNRGYATEMIDIFSFLEASPELFDAMIINDVLEHFEKHEVIRFLDLAYQKLAFGGRLIIKVPNASNPFLASSTLYMDFTHELLFTEESLSQILKGAYFDTVHVYPQDMYVFYNNPLNSIAKCFAYALNASLRALFLLYGRKTTKIFTKNIIAVAEKKNSSIPHDQ